LFLRQPMGDDRAKKIRGGEKDTKGALERIGDLLLGKEKRKGEKKY